MRIINHLLIFTGLGFSGVFAAVDMMILASLFFFIAACSTALLITE